MARSTRSGSVGASPANPKTERIEVRLTPAEKATMTRHATEAGFRSVSEYIVQTLINGQKRSTEAAILSALSRRIGAVQIEAKRDGWSEGVQFMLADTAKAIRLALGFKT